MSRFSERARIASSLSVVLVSCVALCSLGGCEQLDGRNRVRQGNRLFHETQFIDAAAEYQKALTVVEDPIIHYNLGLAYSKVFRPGYEAPVLLGTKDEFVCQVLPQVKMVEAGACVKEGDRHYAECGASKTAPLEKQMADLQDQMKTASDDKKKDLEVLIRDKQSEMDRFVCGSSFHCVESTFCSLTSPELAELAAQHFQVWIKSQPSDDEIRAKLSENQRQLEKAQKDLEEAKKRLEEAKKGLDEAAQKEIDDESKKELNKLELEVSDAQRRIEDLSIKDQTRKIMTQLWIESEQHRKAIEYWESLLQDKPNDATIMGILANITLTAGDWRTSIGWYNKVADVTNDPSSKVAAYQFIGNIAWAKLNSRLLVGADAAELAERGIGALQHAAELQPKNRVLVSLQASIFNFRSTAHGASFASAIDRASAQDLNALTRVLTEEAKKAQGQPPSAPTAPATAPPASTPTPPATGGAAEKSGG